MGDIYNKAEQEWHKTNTYGKVKKNGVSFIIRKFTLIYIEADDTDAITKDTSFAVVKDTTNILPPILHPSFVPET